MENVQLEMQDLDNSCELFQSQIKGYDETSKDIAENCARFHQELAKLMDDYDAKDKHASLTTESFWQVIYSQNIYPKWDKT